MVTMQRATEVVAFVTRQLPDDPVESARVAGLCYVTDADPGITRTRSGRGFAYFDTSGDRIRNRRDIRRFRSLGIPPAWTDVWICPDPSGHIQATGRDDKGRKQYRYHPRWREVRDEAKYERMVAFGHALPAIRECVAKDLTRSGLPRQKVLATVVRLLEATLIRVGNEEYARTNRSFGLTTMRNRHVDVSGTQLRFSFRGKSGRRHSVSITDRRLAGIVKRCQELPGQELFEFVDDNGTVEKIDSDDVNKYLRGITGENFTAKDFRTWSGTVLAAVALRDFGRSAKQTQARRNAAKAIEQVAERLGNTPTICRRSYVHPAVIEAYMDGITLPPPARQDEETSASPTDLSPDEATVLAMLQERPHKKAAN